MTANRTLKRDTLKALERAAMQWYRWHLPIFLDEEDLPPVDSDLKRACAAHAQSQAGGKRRRK